MAQLNDYEDVLEVEDVLEILHIGRNTAYKLFRDQKIKSFKIGNTWKIPKKSITEFIENELK